MDVNTTPSPNLNGHHPAPLPTSSGALYSTRPGAVPQSAPTTFPEEIAGWSPRLLLYWLGWAQWGDIALMRWVWVAGVTVSIGLAISPVAGKWWLIVLLIGALTFLSLARPLLAREHFVRFAPDEERTIAETVTHAPIAPTLKIPVYLTGILEVSARQRRFVALPGFYRTFATREHALICQCHDRRILGIGVPPERDLGLWYAFLSGSQLVRVERGVIAPGGAPLPTLRVTYEARHVKQRGISNGIETLYISAASSEDLARIAADLLYDWPGAKEKTMTPVEALPVAPTKA